METARSLMSTMRDRNKNQFQNKGKDWGGILGNKANEVADEGYWWLYSCCCTFIQAGIATSDSCTKRLPGRVEDVHYWLVSRGEERGGLILWTYRGVKGRYDRFEQVATPNELLQVHYSRCHILLSQNARIMYLVQVQVSYPHHNNNKLEIPCTVGARFVWFARPLGVKRMACIN